MNVRWITVALFLAGLTAPAGGAEVSVTVAPEIVWTIEVDGVQKVNFDLLLTNGTVQTLAIHTIELMVFDHNGSFVTARELNGLGMAPALETLAHTSVPPGQRIVVFNPFHEFPASVELGTMRLAVELTPEPAEGDGADAPGPGHRVEVQVHPRRAEMANALRLPVEGKIFVWDGNDFYAHHRRFDLAHPFVIEMGIRHNFTRYGLDLMMVDPAGRRHRGAGTRPEDYLIFGSPVLAPADGVVIDRIDGRIDSPIGQMTADFDAYQRTKDLRLFGGNFVIIDHGHGEISYLAHLRQGSVRVQKGDRVRAGQQIAQVGNSGDSLEPHLHYQILASPVLDGPTKPAIFSRFRRYHGRRAVEVAAGTVDTGDLVESGWVADGDS